VPGQEEGNIDYVVSKGAGAWCPSPIAVLKQIRHWLSNPDELAAMRAASAALAKPEAAIDIARVLMRFL
jgi:UDP-N-acetylglucosamine:LPS N-acetylglucosamine transferase